MRRGGASHDASLPGAQRDRNRDGVEAPGLLGHLGTLGEILGRRVYLALVGSGGLGGSGGAGSIRRCSMVLS